MAGATVATRLFGPAPRALAQAEEGVSGTPKQALLADLEVYPFNMESRDVIRIALGTMSASNVLVRRTAAKTATNSSPAGRSST